MSFREGSSSPPGFKGWRSLQTFEIVGPIIVLLLILIALIGPLFTVYDPFQQDLTARLLPPLSEGHFGAHLLGTDHLGRDLLSRIIVGTRYSLLIGFVAVAFAALIGLILGVLAGYYGGFVDMAIMSVVSLQLAFPFILFAMTLVAIVGGSIAGIIGIFVLTSWPSYARLVRGVVLSLREREFVEAARAIGARDSRILARHIALGCLGPLIVLASYEVGRLVIIESALGFLGVGIRPPTPTWGNILADGRDYIRSAWWLTVFPGIGIFTIGLGANLSGELLEKRVNPQVNRRTG